MSQNDSTSTEFSKLSLKALGLRPGMALQTRRMVEGAQKNESQYFSAIEGKGVMVGPLGADSKDTGLTAGEVCVVRGFTGQYEELENLYRENKDKLVILGFPANDFKEQEKKDNADIASFCKINYGVSFQLMQKSQVVKGAAQNPVFQWLSQPAQNGWCEQAPLWNFSKYLIDEQGVLQGFYSQMISPKKVL